MEKRFFVEGLLAGFDSPLRGPLASSFPWVQPFSCLPPNHDKPRSRGKTDLLHLDYVLC
jgi:hypothetical protein